MLSHLRSVIALVDTEQYKDANSIARIMSEGLAILLWANKKPDERPLDWRAYVCVDQFRHSYGHSNYSEQQEYLETMLDKYCRKYLKEEYKTKPQGEIVPDNYLSSWRREENDKNKFVKVTIKEIFDDVGLKNIHDISYDVASGWLHWDSFSMGETIDRKVDGGIICGIEPKYLGAAAIASGIYALFNSVSLLDEHLKLGFESRLKDLHKKIEEGTKIKSQVS